MKYILAVDFGYGDTKVVGITSDGQIKHKFKFPSMVGITKKNEHINSTKIYDYKEHSYQVGENASSLPSESLIDITEYKNLEYYAPLFLYHVLKQIKVKPDIVVTGLSKAQLEQSGHFKAAVQDFEVNGEKIILDNVFVLPQGAGSKLTIDKFGTHFPKQQDEFGGASTFVGCDIGFNTLDMFKVDKGETDPSLFEGIEREGIMKIAIDVAKKVKEIHGRQITLHEAKEILDTGIYKLRGQKHPFDDYVQEIKKDYLKNLLSLIESKYGKIIDKCDFIFVSGGGSTIFKSTDDNFIRVPETAHEFYNAIGFALFGKARA